MDGVSIQLDQVAHGSEQCEITHWVDEGIGQEWGSSVVSQPL